MKDKGNPNEINLESPGALFAEIMKRLPLVCPWPLMLGADDILMYRRAWVRKISYVFFEIPKKNGGTRQILAPKGILKYILKTINSILRELWVPMDFVHGFAPGRSVVTGAAPHVGAPYVFHMDIKDFFTSIKAVHVYMALVYELGLNRVTAWIISELCTYPAGGSDVYLPQGSPASPILSNIVFAAMDRSLKGLADCFGLTYTRYADDITFSGPYNAFREGGSFRTCLDRMISEEGFSVNPAKTRLQKRGGRQDVTGLTVCEKVNVPRKWLKGLRAQIHRMEVGGCTPRDLASAWGKIAWLRQVRGGSDPCSRKLVARLCVLEVGLYNAGLDDENETKD